MPRKQLKVVDIVEENPVNEEQITEITPEIETQETPVLACLSEIEPVKEPIKEEKEEETPNITPEIKTKTKTQELIECVKCGQFLTRSTLRYYHDKCEGYDKPIRRKYVKKVPDPLIKEQQNIIEQQKQIIQQHVIQQVKPPPPVQEKPINTPSPPKIVKTPNYPTLQPKQLFIETHHNKLLQAKKDKSDRMNNLLKKAYS